MVTTALSLAEQIKAGRKSLSMTQQQLADAMGVKRSLIGAYEEGRAIPKPQFITQFKAATGIDIVEAKQVALPSLARSANISNSATPWQTSLPTNGTQNAGCDAVPQPRERVLPAAARRELTLVYDPKDKPLMLWVRQAELNDYCHQQTLAKPILELSTSGLLPGLAPNQVYRGFQLFDNQPYVVGRLIRNWSNVKPNTPYLAVTNQGISQRIVETRLLEDPSLLELWEVVGSWTLGTPPADPAQLDLRQEIDVLRQQIAALVK